MRAGSYGSPSRAGVARYLTNGSLDTTFAGNGKAGTSIDSGVTISALDFGRNSYGQPGVIVGGQVSEPYSGTTGGATTGGTTGSGGSICNHAVLIRYTDAGALDTTFGSGGKALLDFGLCVAGESSEIVALRVDSDNSIVVAGATTRTSPTSSVSQLVVARVDSWGALIRTFGSNGVALVSYGTSFPAVHDLQLANGSIVIAAEVELGQSADEGHPDAGQLPSVGTIARFTSSGLPDTTFNGSGFFILPAVDPSAPNGIRWAHVNGDDSILFVAGASYTQEGNLQNHTLVGRLTSSGQLDSSYGSGGTIEVGALVSTAPQYAGLDSSGRILVGSSSYVGFLVSRLLATGQIDTAYNTPHGYTTFTFNDVQDQLHGLTVDASNRAVVCGATSDGDFGVARLTTTGILDTSF